MAESIIGSFLETVSNRANEPAARFRERSAQDQWVTRTWAEIDHERQVMAAGLMELGFSKNERAVILADTSYEWILADLAVLSCGGQTVPIYPSNLRTDCEYIIGDCGAVFAVVDNAAQLAKLDQKMNPNLRKVIVMDDDRVELESTDWTVGWSEVRALGEMKLEERSEEIAARVNDTKPQDILTLIYTSGTTGTPKGVVLTHGNMLYEIAGSKELAVVAEGDVQFLFLPMAHVFAKYLECAWIGTGHEVVVDGEIARVADNLAEVEPTLVASVPRIFEKVYAKVVQGGLEGSGLKGKLFRWALSLNDRYAQLMIENEPIPFGLDLQLSLAKKLVFSKVNEKLRERFGRRLRFFVSGGGPLPKKMAYFFDNAGIKILEGYGLTETSAATCVNREDSNRIGTVGPPFPGTELKIADDGEILIKGPGVMLEYWNQPSATKEVLDAEGWFATGDIGVIDQDGYLRITDRKKDLIVTAGGKNVAPQKIESLLKSANPLISQVVVHGDRRKFLSALITLEPTAAVQIGRENGIEGGYLAICKSQQARDAVEATIETVNRELARYETIKKFHILESDLEVGKELTPTLKVKRKVVTEQYRSILDGFYQEQVE